MDDLISRQGVIEVLSQYPFEKVVNCISIIEEFPSAQSDIILCKDCRNNHWCNIQEAAMAGDNFFCGAAERRTDERSNR